MTYYTALDVSLRSVSVCIVDDQGEVRHEAKVAAEVDKITRHFSFYEGSRKRGGDPHAQSITA